MDIQALWSGWSEEDRDLFVRRAFRSQQTKAWWRHHGARLGLPTYDEARTLRRWVKDRGLHKVTRIGGLGVDAIAEDAIDLDELVEQRTRDCSRRIDHARQTRERTVRVPVEGPIGLVVFGDPHLDSDFCDMRALRSHLQVVKDNEAVWGVSLGDHHNNWHGRLALLYGEQDASARTAWRLVEWFCHEIDWLMMVSGNHDCWSGAGDPLRWIVRQAAVATHAAHEVRAQLVWPGGEEMVMHVRHNFPGHSQWHPLHGMLKAARMFAPGSDLYLQGHRHTWGSMTLEPHTGHVVQCVMAAGYKAEDDFAKKLGYRPTEYGAACFLVLDPAARGPGRVRVFWDVEQGAQFLRHLRAGVATSEQDTG